MQIGTYFMLLPTQKSFCLYTILNIHIISYIPIVIYYYILFLKIYSLFLDKAQREIRTYKPTPILYYVQNVRIIYNYS